MYFPFIIPLAPTRGEVSPLRPGNDPDGIARAWQKNTVTQNQANASGQAHQIANRKINRQSRWRGIPEQDTVYHPFKVSNSPFNVDMPDYEANWRSFRVRAGAYGTTAVLNTDGADANPLNPLTEVSNIEFDVLIDFVVPDATAAYYVWVNAADADSPFIDHGTTIPGGGTDDDWWGGIYFLIATIDTNTYTTEKRPIIRQWENSDIPKCL